MNLKLLLSALLILFSINVQGQSVIVNEVSNETLNTQEWVELFTTQAIDLRGFQVRDFSSSGNPQTPLTFNNNVLWENVSAGVIILITGSETGFGEDLDPSDGVLIIRNNNSAFFSGAQFSIAGSSEAIQVLDGDDNHVHGLSYGSANQNSLSSPKAHVSGRLDVGQSAGFFGTSALSNFSSGFFAKVFDASTPAAGNDGDNAAFISDLFLSSQEVARLRVSLGNSTLRSGDVLRFAKLGETKTIQLSNPGNRNLTISDIITSGKGFSDNFQAPAEIPPSTSLTFELSFIPPSQTDEIFSGSLTIESNAADNTTFTVNLESRPELSQDDTFEIVTWNIEWFGSTSNGPTDETLQTQNAATVLRNIDADVYALQEITSNTALQELVNLLDGYRGFMANHIRIQQKLAFIYKTSTIDSLSSGPVSQRQDINDWAQRLPFSFRIGFNVGNQTETFTLVNIHAKANTGSFSDRQEAYFQRVRAADALHQYLISDRPNDHIIIAGDYNDDVDISIFDNRTSPYDVFINDNLNFRVLTAVLSDRQEQSTIGFSDMIDHISITDELFNNFMVDTQEVFPAENLISNYGSTTSDHFPVMARFDFSTNFTDFEETEHTDIPEIITLRQNYPNPFNPSTTIAFNLNQASEISLKIYDILGRQVSQPIANRRFNAGSHQISFDASGLSSGVYVYRLAVQGGPAITRKMTLIK